MLMNVCGMVWVLSACSKSGFHLVLSFDEPLRFTLYVAEMSK